MFMMENRSFDQMFGGLKATDVRIDGLGGSQFDLDTIGGTRSGSVVLAESRLRLKRLCDEEHHTLASREDIAAILVNERSCSCT